MPRSVKRPNKNRHLAGADLRCTRCGSQGPWDARERCERSRGYGCWSDREKVEARRSENSRAFAAALEAHDALGGTPLTVEERLQLRCSLGP